MLVSFSDNDQVVEAESFTLNFLQMFPKAFPNLQCCIENIHMTNTEDWIISVLDLLYVSVRQTTHTPLIDRKREDTEPENIPSGKCHFSQKR